MNAPGRRTFTGLRDYEILLLETGLRLNEITAVQIDDVKILEGQIIVRHTKGHKHRYVPIQAKIRELLCRYIKIRGTCEAGDTEQSLAINVRDCAFIFCEI